MAFDAKVAVVERFIEEAFVRFRNDEMPYLLAKSFTSHAWDGLGLAPGRVGTMQLIDCLRAAFSDAACHIEDILVDGDKVVARYTFEATHSGAIFGIPASGRRVSCTSILIARLEHCQIAELWREEDRLGILRQMGALPLAA